MQPKACCSPNYALGQVECRLKHSVAAGRRISRGVRDMSGKSAATIEWE
jgi:GMP synthase PP-ATPase subunit